MAHLEQAKSQTSPTPAAAAGDTALSKKRVARGVDDLNTPPTAAKGRQVAQEVSRPGQGAAIGDEEQATPEEQAEYERAVEALSKVLYQDDRTSAAIVQQLMPQEKVGSVAKASMLLIQQLDGRLDFDEVIIPQFTQTVVDRLIDLYEQVHEDEFSEEEAQAALGSAWEGIMEMYGVDEDTYAELTAGMSDDEFSGYEQQYKTFLGEAK